DIGTDHAYLPVYLLENGIVERAIASDLRKGPLENARKTVEESGMSDIIELRLSDGFDSYEPYEAQEIAICGMGGLLISDFINRTEWLKDGSVHLIVQPMTHIADARKALFKNGFSINKEVVVKDDNHFYIVISAYYEKIKGQLPNYKYEVGFFDKKSELAQEYLRYLFDKHQKKYQALYDSGHDYEDTADVLEEINRWLK
ncbi:MAG: class I SAM-dependent methyltransferase, partial [Clostridiales bacterium]|nr:class I SAM-dependent methyltransferase [Clostridiales bacterium]